MSAIGLVGSIKVRPTNITSIHIYISHATNLQKTYGNTTSPSPIPTMPPSPFSLPPPHLLLFQLLSASAAIGLTPSTSWLRPAALPVLSTCSFYIIRDAAQSMRPRWAALLGGFSVAIVLRYLDIGLLSRWSYENHGPAPSRLSSSPSGNKERDDSFLQRLKYGWYTLWSFRQVNTPWEVKNVPTFSTSVPSYVPSRGPFVVQQAAAAWTCYILLDLLAQRAPPANPAQLFDPKLVPVFARWHSVTASEVKLRFLTIAGFAATFYCIIQGFQSMAAALAVGAGVSPVENWRPAFGSVLDAYSLKNVWGYVVEFSPVPPSGWDFFFFYKT
jgi:hypothetical protein